MKKLSNFRGRLFIPGLVCLISTGFCGSAHGDITSSQYSIAESQISGGGGIGQSSSYAVQNGRVTHMNSGTQSSTNYQMNAGAGMDLGNKLPVLQSASPADLARFFTDQQASFSVTALSSDGDSLQYKALQDTTVKAGPQSSSSLSWSLSAADKGRRTVSFEVIDPQGTVSKSQYFYAFRRPVK